MFLDLQRNNERKGINDKISEKSCDNIRCIHTFKPEWAIMCPIPPSKLRTCLDKVSETRRIHNNNQPGNTIKKNGYDNADQGNDDGEGQCFFFRHLH